MSASPSFAAVAFTVRLTYSTDVRLCLPTPSSFVHLPPSSISPFLDSIHISFLLRRNCSISSPPPASFALSLILILAGDIQLNPGPVPLEFAHLNVRSLSSITPTLDKPFLLSDFISDFSIELLAICETWLSYFKFHTRWFFIHTLTSSNWSCRRSWSHVSFLSKLITSSYTIISF